MLGQLEVHQLMMIIVPMIAGKMIMIIKIDRITPVNNNNKDG